MNNKNILIGVALVVAIGVVGYFFFPQVYSERSATNDLDSTPQNTTLTGTYECLPHIDNSQTKECAPGLYASDGNHYGVDFSVVGNAEIEFKVGKTVTAEGMVVIKEALSSDHWFQYNMKGIFRIERFIENNSSAKIDINVVCQNAIAYMSFPDAASAEIFIKDCKEGKHPEVIEAYKAQMNLDGATI